MTLTPPDLPQSTQRAQSIFVNENHADFFLLKPKLLCGLSDLRGEKLGSMAFF
jgi:hypothetical protein